MLETAAINNIVRWLRHWDDRSKLLLINKISDTMLNPTKSKDETFYHCFGAYESEERDCQLSDNLKLSDN